MTCIKVGGEREKEPEVSEFIRGLLKAQYSPLDSLSCSIYCVLDNGYDYVSTFQMYSILYLFFLIVELVFIKIFFIELRKLFFKS